MAEENLRGEEKEILRRRLELLQKEYERTAQRLQRAERKAAVRRHVQNRISDENRQLQINTTGLSQLSPASSSVPNSNLLSNQPLQSEIKPDDGFLSSKKHPLVRFHLPDGSDDSPCSTPTCRRSPTHRLRSKRSRLRLQSKEKESDIDSQDKAKEGVEERPGEKRDCDSNTKENSVEMERGGEKEQTDITRGHTVEEKIQNGDPEVMGSDGEINKEQLTDRLSKGDRNPNDVGLQMCSIAENSSVNPLPGEVFQISQVEVKTSLANQSADINSQSSSSASDQLFMQIQSYQSTGLSEQSDNQQEDDTKREVNSAGIDSVDEINAPFSSEKNGILDSCTLIEGLPFPVEYYVRTTRRMAAAHSPVDLNAVILSQLSRGRGRRRSSSSQARGSNHLTSGDSQQHGKSLDQPRCRGRGRRGRRGRRRTRAEGVTKSSQARSCTDNFSKMEPESLTETESSTQSPQSQSLLQTSLPQLEPASQAELTLTPKPVLNTQPEAADFKHLSDSQLYLDCKFLPDREVYPIFRRRRSQVERAGSCSQAQTQTESTNGKDCRPLLSLVSLAQALKMTNCTPLSQLLTSSDIQDFHLPDDEFGQLKLQRLRTSCLNVEPLSLHYSANNTRCNSPRYSFRNLRNKNSAEGQRTDNELFFPELLPSSAHLEGSFVQSETSSADQLLTPRNTEQSEKHKKTANQLKSDTGSQKSCQSGITCLADVNDQGTKDCIPLNNTKDEETPVVYNYKEVEENAGEHKHDLKTCEELKQDSGSPCPAVLNFSMTLTPHMEHGPDSSLPSLGITPHLLSSVSPSDFSLIQPPPSDQRVSLSSFQPAENSSPAVPAFNQNPSAGQNICRGTLQSQSQTTERDLQTLIGLDPVNEAWLSPVTKSPLQNVYNNVSSISENCHRATDAFEEENQYLDSQTGNQSQNQLESKLEDQVQREGLSPLQSDSSCVNKTCSLDPSVIQTASSESVLAIDMADTDHKLTEHTLAMENPAHLVSQMMDTKITCQSQAAEDMRNSDKTISCGTFQKTHRFKALEGGCVLDVCLVQWPSDDWCVCVAGEWSVCVWAQKAGVQQWSLIHTWTFTQSIISLQGVPDSPGLLCVSLGRLEITEVRILHCSSIDGEFSQAEVCKGALQAVVAVSDCRLVCCSAPGAQQKVQVFILSQDCRVSDILSLVSTSRSIRTLATVEREKDALIGWTECKTLLIWNMKSGQLLQSIRLTEAVSTSTCLKGYSYKGALCVLFQSASSTPCDEKNDAVLFTLIALNPLTGKHFTLTSVTSPSVSCSERLIDGDVCESMLAGIFQSGHLTVWDLKGDVTGVLGGVEAQSCRLARWAGPSTLLTGYLNGDVHLYQFKPTESKTNCC